MRTQPCLPLALLMPLLLWGCAATPAPSPSSYDPQAAPRSAAATGSDETRPQTPEARAIEVLLREADAALGANRLTTPTDDNALDRFLHVLVLAPDDARARAGIDEIARRYQRWAVRAAGNGEAERAAEFLDLAEQVSARHPALAATRAEIGRALAVPRERHALARPELDARDPALAARLAGLGTRAKEEDLFVVITAPVDAWSRWIYQQMNDAPPALRLRARSEIGPTPSVELRAMD